MSFEIEVSSIKKRLNDIEKEIKNTAEAFALWDLELEIEKSLKIFGPEKTRKILIELYAAKSESKR